MQGRILAETSVSSRDEEDGAGRGGGEDGGMEGSILMQTSSLSFLIGTLAEIQRKR